MGPDVKFQLHKQPGTENRRQSLYQRSKHSNAQDHKREGNKK